MATAQDRTTELEVQHVDGRTMRRTRNRTAVIAALLAIVREGNLRPGAAEIADRAGVSHRSIFRYFEDLDDLARTAIDYAFMEAGPLADIPEIGEGDLPGRIAAMVDARLALYESVDGTMQLARMRASSIPSIDEGIARIAVVFKEQVTEHFATELATIDEVERDLMIDAILVLTSYDSFTLHRRVLRSDAERTRAAWVYSLSTLLN
jgi:AcrR family transcriptional regulator